MTYPSLAVVSALFMLSKVVQCLCAAAQLNIDTSVRSCSPTMITSCFEAQGTVDNVLINTIKKGTIHAPAWMSVRTVEHSHHA